MHPVEEFRKCSLCSTVNILHLPLFYCWLLHSGQFNGTWKNDRNKTTGLICFGDITYSRQNTSTKKRIGRQNVFGEKKIMKKRIGTKCFGTKHIRTKRNRTKCIGNNISGQNDVSTDKRYRKRKSIRDIMHFPKVCRIEKDVPADKKTGYHQHVGRNRITTERKSIVLDLKFCYFNGILRDCLKSKMA